MFGSGRGSLGYAEAANPKTSPPKIAAFII
jgi:hypothetical protein